MGLESSLKRFVRWSVLHPAYLSRRGIRRAVQGNISYARGLVLDVGCGSQPFRDMFVSRGLTYVGVDIKVVPGVDFCATIQALPVRDSSVDTVLCVEVLEHAQDPFVVARQLLRILKPGGHLILTTPQTWGLHGEPHDYYRFTRHGIRHVLESVGFEIHLIEAHGGLFAMLGARLADGWAEFILPPRSRPISRWGWRVILVPVALATAVTSNIIGLLLDTVVPITTDPIGHIVVAEKPSSDTV